MRISQILTAVFVATLLVAAVPASAATGNYTLGVQSGTTSDTYAAENLPNADVMGYDSIDLAIAALELGDVDFVLGDLPTLKFYQAADSDGLSIAGSFSEEDFGLAVAPGEDALLGAINMALGEIIDSGEYDTIFAASFGDEIVVLTDDTDANTATAYPNATGALATALDAGTIAFGTDPYYPPFESYIENTTDMVGFDVDMANAIAAKIGAAYNDTNFSATMVEKSWDEILTFQYDGYDATLSAMTKTAQRAENTDFSRAYYSSKQGILASADSPTISGVADLNGTYEVADPVVEEEDDSPSVALVVSALTVGLIAVARRKN